MIAFAWNILLALIWVLLAGDFSGTTFLLGMIFGYIVLALMQSQIPILGDYGQRVPRVIAFVFFFLWQVIKSNVRVAWEVMTPGLQIKPGVIGVPLTANSDMEITILANLITLTPGTLSLDVSDDRRVLYIHAMYLDDEEAVLSEIKYMEGRILQIFR
ncbi:MAG: Na+/H+ antiporter subunit E [Bradymonadaceae bacterium]